MYNQVELFTDPSLLNDTYMVSVSHIWVNISLSTNSSHTFRFASDFTDGYDDSDTVGREINKMGHLIYGFLWDTELDAAPVGVYKCLGRVHDRLRREDGHRAPVPDCQRDR